MDPACALEPIEEYQVDVMEDECTLDEVTTAESLAKVEAPEPMPVSYKLPSDVEELCKDVICALSSSSMIRISFSNRNWRLWEI